MEEILTWQTAVLSVSCFVLTFLLRRVVEGSVRSLQRTEPPAVPRQLWENVALPCLPPAFGALLSLTADDLMPDGVDAVVSRVLFGLVCGFFSAWTYQVVKAVLTKLAPGMRAPEEWEDDDADRS